MDEERIARILCATFRKVTMEKLEEEIAKHGDDFLKLWRRLARAVIEDVKARVSTRRFVTADVKHEGQRRNQPEPMFGRGAMTSADLRAYRKTIEDQAVRVADVEAERDRQYEENVSLIMRIAALEAENKTAQARRFPSARDGERDRAQVIAYRDLKGMVRLMQQAISALSDKNANDCRLMLQCEWLSPTERAALQWFIDCQTVTKKARDTQAVESAGV
jgi:hypothetical protein